jgi:hypothetical protein
VKSQQRRVFVASAALELFFGVFEDEYMGGEGEPRVQVDYSV